MTTNKITDKSNDKGYFTQMPNIVLAKCRNPQDIALWITIKMVAGDQGECILTTDDLAELATMSAGKASDCRKFLIKAGLICGELRRDEGYPQPVWHLSVPDLWEENVKWCKENHSLKGKIQKRKTFKAELIAAKTLRTTNPKTEKKEENADNLHNVKGKEPSQYEEGVTQNEGGVTQNETNNIHLKSKRTSSRRNKKIEQPQPAAKQQPAMVGEDDDLLKFISYFKAKKQGFTTPKLQTAVVMAIHTYGVDRAIELYDEALLRGATDLPSYVLTLARNGFTPQPVKKPASPTSKLTPEQQAGLKALQAQAAQYATVQ